MTAKIPIGIVLIALTLHTRDPFGFGTSEGVVSVTSAAYADCARLTARPMAPQTTLEFEATTVFIALPFSCPRLVGMRGARASAKPLPGRSVAKMDSTRETRRLPAEREVMRQVRLAPPRVQNS